MKDLPAETQVLLYNAIADYALYDIEPDFDHDGIARGFFTLMRPQIDANSRRRDAGFARRATYEIPEQPNHTNANRKPMKNLAQTKPKPMRNHSLTKP